jgi:hypothetical protein
LGDEATNARCPTSVNSQPDRSMSSWRLPESLRTVAFAAVRFLAGMAEPCISALSRLMKQGFVRLTSLMMVHQIAEDEN